MVKVQTHFPQIIPRSQHPISRRLIDEDALRVLYQLYRAGHTAYLVGGGVRDLLLGRFPKDFDVATSARPAQVRRVFRNCRLIGRRFRLAHIHFLDGKIIELSTFRAQPDAVGAEGDGPVTSDNKFGTPHLDALRRDFTINSLFYDVSTFSVIDYAGGLEDLHRGVIRTIGDPRLRFQEDPVRMLRAIRFAARLGFSVEDETWKAMTELTYCIEKVPPPRVLEEWARLLEEGGAARAFDLLDQVGLLEYLEPSLEAYLRLAERGEIAGDPDARLFFRLFAVADEYRHQEYRLSRSLLISLWCLPLLAEQGFFDSDASDALFRECALPVLIRLGISRKESEQCQDILVLFKRLIDRKKRRAGKPLPSREFFLEAVLLLSMWYRASGRNLADWERWQAELPRALARFENPKRRPRQAERGAVSVEDRPVRAPKQRRVRRRIAVQEE